MVQGPEDRQLLRGREAGRRGAYQDERRDQHRSHDHEPRVAAGGGEFPGRSGQTLEIKRDPYLRKPGLYVFTCKVHPYMFGAVIVDDPQTEGLDIGAELQLVTGAKIPTTSDIAKKLLRTFFVTTTPALWRDYRKPNWEVKLPELPINLGGKVIKMSDLNFYMPNTLLQPQTPGIGEVWADTQFEGVSEW